MINTDNTADAQRGKKAVNGYMNDIYRHYLEKQDDKDFEFYKFDIPNTSCFGLIYRRSYPDVDKFTWGLPGVFYKDRKNDFARVTEVSYLFLQNQNALGSSFDETEYRFNNLEHTAILITKMMEYED